ncbi:hypothetical protein CcarbDRAFT_5026 [Clostridium carboxidivorans P7]|uniref:Uncharacterized protein n=1 Tax=Clostridium carboxidivorans P7 TaxID=536227 RepID=C6Q1V8_9CLOT|nr:hypothetical protein [Clostridium drakei]EET84516.1 hypothetical protein CcarbDRAFT_5026 [Clostridium carboxidivorans P7]
MEVRLSLEQFKLLALRYQKAKKKGKKDLDGYIADRSLRIKKRCGYFK